MIPERAAPKVCVRRRAGTVECDSVFTAAGHQGIGLGAGKRAEAATVKLVGILGEIRPKVLNSWEIENPVVSFEIDLEKLPFT